MGTRLTSWCSPLRGCVELLLLVLLFIGTLCALTTARKVSSQENADIVKFLDETFSERPDHLEAWKTLILGDKEATQHLRTALAKVDALGRPYLPARRAILRALTFQPPTEIKAIVCGLDPIPVKELATGLAFSFPKKPPNAKATELYKGIELQLRGERRWGKGRAVVQMKRALRQAGVEPEDDFNLNYQHWAERGVLLWNAALTVLDGVSAFHLKHAFWLPFSKRLLLLVVRASHHRPVVGMFWGTYAAQIRDYIVAKATGDEAELCEKYDHPTFTERVPGKEFLPNAARQFGSRPDLFGPPGYQECWLASLCRNFMHTLSQTWRLLGIH